MKKLMLALLIALIAVSLFATVAYADPGKHCGTNTHWCAMWIGRHKRQPADHNPTPEFRCWRISNTGPRPGYCW